MKQNAGINVTLQMGVFNSSGSLSDTVISKLQILWEAFPHFMFDHSFKTEPSFIFANLQNNDRSVLWWGGDMPSVLRKPFKYMQKGLDKSWKKKTFVAYN